MKRIILTLMLCGIAFGAYDPAPVVNPDGIAFDPNLAPSPVMGAYQVKTGSKLNGQFDVVVSSDRTISVTTDLTLGTPAKTEDPNGVVKYVYDWSYQTAIPGITYHNVKIVSNQDEHENRTIVIKALTNQKPLITGCRAF